LSNPVRYAKVSLPVKMPPINEKITMLSFPELEDSVPFLEQSIGAIATRGLLEITSCRLKYPTLSVKETALKLFAMFLKANNPSNTLHTKKKYQKKIRQFVDRCDMPVTLFNLHNTKKKKGRN
jgi:adenylate/nucleoside-diphosphate kinase